MGCINGALLLERQIGFYVIYAFIPTDRIQRFKPLHITTSTPVRVLEHLADRIGEKNFIFERAVDSCFLRAAFLCLGLASGSN